MDAPTTQGSPVDALPEAWRLMTPPSKIAVALSAVAVLLAASFALPMVGDLVTPAPKPLKKVDDPAKNAEQQKVTFDGYLAQVRGRSLFFVPPAPRAADATPKVDENKPPPPPSSYGGPSIVAMLSDAVWFSSGKRLKVGEKDGDVKVVALMPPWSSRLEWKGVEFDVNFFERSKLTKPATDASSSSKSEGAKADMAKTDGAKTDGGKTDVSKPEAGKPETAEPAKAEEKPSQPKPAAAGEPKPTDQEAGRGGKGRNGEDGGRRGQGGGGGRGGRRDRP